MCNFAILLVNILYTLRHSKFVYTSDRAFKQITHETSTQLATQMAHFVCLLVRLPISRGISILW